MSLAPRARVLLTAWAAALACALPWLWWAARTRSRWMLGLSPPGWGAAALATAVGVVGAVMAGRIAGDRTPAGLGRGAWAGGLMGGITWLVGAASPSLLRAQWGAYDLVRSGQSGPEAAARMLVEGLESSALLGVLPCTLSLLAGAALGALGARGGSALTPGDDPAATWLFVGPAVALLAAITSFVGVTAVARTLTALEGNGAPATSTLSLVLVNHAALSGFAAALLGHSTGALVTRSTTRRRAVATLHGLALALLLLWPVGLMQITPALAQLPAWWLLLLAPIGSSGLGLRRGRRTGATTPTLNDIALEGLWLATLLAVLGAGPGGWAVASVIAVGVAPMLPALETGATLELTLHTSPAAHVAPRALAAGLLAGLGVALVFGLPLRWLLGPAPNE